MWRVVPDFREDICRLKVTFRRLTFETKITALITFVPWEKFTPITVLQFFAKDVQKTKKFS